MWIRHAEYKFGCSSDVGLDKFPHGQLHQKSTLTLIGSYETNLTPRFRLAIYFPSLQELDGELSDIAVD